MKDVTPALADYPWDGERDVIVIGSGCAGLSAALLAAKKSLDVVLCEKSSQVGGTTASAGGVMWIPNSREARAAGVDDSSEQVRVYLRALMGAYYRADLVDTYLKSAPLAAQAIQEGTQVRLKLMPAMSDYHASLPGGKAGGRSLEPERFDGRRLGADFELVRAPIKRLMLLGGLYIDKRRIDEFLNPFGSFRNFIGVIRTLARYAIDRTRFSRGTDIGAGNAFVASALLSLRERGVPIWLDSPMVSLVRNPQGGVAGVAICRDGKLQRIRARKGVILAAGGFPRNAALLEELAGGFPHDQSVGYEGNVGDTLQAARQTGAAIDADLASPCWWTPTSRNKEADGSMSTVLYGYLDRSRPGMIAVNAAGKRFVNDSDSYHDIVSAMFKDGVTPDSRFYLICDRRFVWKRGFGNLIKPYCLSLGRYVRSGYISTGRSIRELAAAIGIDPDALDATVTRHNGFCETGVDLDFGKGGNPYNRMFGDPRVKPNPNLLAIRHAPFFALRIYPGTLGTILGLKATADAQVVGQDGEAIPGLYACGNDMSSVFRGFYPGAGATLGPGLVFAYRAIEHLARSSGGSAAQSA
ncbi:FAD-dependent oxidoreductase [Bordetella bronchiseptica]|uniref:FAD-dependent oxidoreductase n=1 Tax=Bordetella bronchiseptica TaxID=518 RepID=UPI00045ACA2B|nr:FAD-dependent oxidoreductase [Bordetella bronchiseptica]KAK52184.1 FAD binding domain protein [Bordetella bronchiseptica OSU054]KDB75027.1 FAD binding domain protein [Bordetella bronchiseptica CA90 BB1334]KDD41427.1 FAD binding domain protein [Bordetella bronchiseptica OSU095]KDD49605.1 FAD binding domain protein [Bordetella bronchiseptica MBORD901]